MELFFHIQILRTCWVSNDFLGIYGTWIWKFSASARITEVLTCTLDFESSRLPFLDNLIKRGRTNLTEEDGTNSGCCVTAEAMFGLWNDSALSKHTWAHHHIQKGNSEQKDMLQNSILRKKEKKHNTTSWRQIWFVIRKRKAHTLYNMHEVLRWEHTQSQTQTPICFQGFCIDTYICQWGRRRDPWLRSPSSSTAGSTRRAGCPAQTRTGRRAQSPPPSERRRPSTAHTARGETNGECLQHSHLQNTAWTLWECGCQKWGGSRQVGNSYERASNPKVTEKDGSMKTPLLSSGFSEPSQMISTLCAIPLLPLRGPTP